MSYIRGSWRNPAREELALKLYRTTLRPGEIMARVNEIPGPRLVRVWQEISDFASSRRVTRPDYSWRSPERMEYLAEALPKGTRPQLIMKRLEALPGGPIPAWDTVYRACKAHKIFSPRTIVREKDTQSKPKPAIVILPERRCLRCRVMFVPQHKGRFCCDNCNSWMGTQGSVIE